MMGTIMRIIQLPMRSTALALLLLAGAMPARAQDYKGVNLAGAAYSSNKIPGRYGYDYLFPKPGEVTYFHDRGMNIFRLSVLWERLQPAPGVALDSGYMGRINGFVDQVHAVGGKVILDIHDYGRYRGTLIGDGQVTAADFRDLWTRLGTAFRDRPDVWFGLMNEPQQKSAEAWRDIEQQAILGIRAAGARNPILVSGVGWDAAHGFATVNAPALATLKDPDHSLVFEVHEYFDPDSSGRSPDCIPTDQAVARLASFTAWLHQTGNKGFLGEFGVGRSAACLDVLDKVASYLAANQAVWLGWTYWAAGPLWGEYMYTLEPTKTGQDRPQMLVLDRYLTHRGR
ncbi:putative endoglucanase precursor (EC 3.2.1.4) (Endo-1,4-beta-glucanase (Cellulase) [Gluconacetobacter diazotrophicus PA1 5]|uniref:Putative endoglucanase n=3 Tax=Gluconacetobacter diazotrophicus TaxID=33996 RepID=A9HNP5_GLUDA|nr:putative endoglucanase precursor (EC 3.2.1.4) (Endo-1,4-beta-glucanase (Cellulase) [Gluconacetobacter diazotrophicus PA1 5]